MKISGRVINLSGLWMLLSSTLVTGLLVLASIPSSSAGSHGDRQSAAKKDIIETAVSAGSFTTLVTAIEAAGLVETLKGEGPFTVFAPTDEAFAKIPSDQLDALLQDREALTKVLTYHVVPGKVTSADVIKLDKAETVEGQPLRISSADGVMINDARVIKADVMTSNGVIHAIDGVLMPN
jgi:uncharacterized surface protein with fasciclin (FAS1) repeats